MARGLHTSLSTHRVWKLDVVGLRGFCPGSRIWDVESLSWNLGVGILSQNPEIFGEARQKDLIFEP